MDCRFDVGDEGVHPLEQTDLAGLARADDDRSVFGHTGPGGIEAGQPIGDQVNTLVQGRSGPFSHPAGDTPCHRVPPPQRTKPCSRNHVPACPP